MTGSLISLLAPKLSTMVCVCRGPTAKSAAVCGPLTGELDSIRGKGTGSTKLRWWRRESEYAAQPAGEKPAALSNCSLQSTVALRVLPALTALAVSLCTTQLCAVTVGMPADRGCSIRISPSELSSITSGSEVLAGLKRLLLQNNGMSCCAALQPAKGRQGGVPRLCQGSLSRGLDLAPLDLRLLGAPTASASVCCPAASQ